MRKNCLLIGDPVEQSLSSRMHNAAFSALGLDVTYLAKRVKAERLEITVERLRKENILGANVTIPHKKKVMNFLDEMDEKARKIGAVNTIVNDEGELKGFNTDGVGFGKAMNKEGVSLKNKKTTIIGAGGAARAVAWQCLSEGSEIVIANRTLEKAKKVKEEFKRIKVIPLSNENKIKEVIKNADILINATPLGMKRKANETPVKKELLHPNLIVIDLIYQPPETKLLQEAKEVGCQKIVNGLEMLIQQGALSFELWTRKKAPVELMRRIVWKELKKNER